MLFQILTAFAVLLTLLTGAAATKCDNETTSWSDLRDYNTIATTFGNFCDRFDSICTADCKWDDCINVGENHITAMITLDKKIHGFSSLCEQILIKLEKECPHGGTDHFGVEDILNHDRVIAKGNITAHPGRNKCAKSWPEASVIGLEND